MLDTGAWSTIFITARIKYPYFHIMTLHDINETNQKSIKKGTLLALFHRTERTLTHPSQDEQKITERHKMKL